MADEHSSAATLPQAEENRGPPGRILTLDIVRGVAVLGIAAMNVVAFAMPMEAYLNPLAYGWEDRADGVSWVISFLLFDGKMRGLFSFLFGASMLLVIERAEAAGESAARVHFARMAWLLLFGLAHYFFIWNGDILSLYAPVGMIAWFFRERSTIELTVAGIIAIVAQLLLFGAMAHQVNEAATAATAPGAGAAAIETWRLFVDDLTIPTAEELERTLAVYRGSFLEIAAHQFRHELQGPFTSFLVFGPETLGYMLLGMATLRCGFLTGAWSDRSYSRIAIGSLALALPAYALLARALVRAGFDPVSVYALSLTATTAVRPLMVLGYAALIILLTRRGGALTQRLAAAGRAAFTNYLGTSILMTALFYGWGLGLYGHLGRAELWLAVLPAWALMLLWSKPWLQRFRYGPFEWLWRTLARGHLQPMRR